MVEAVLSEAPRERANSAAVQQVDPQNSKSTAALNGRLAKYLVQTKNYCSDLGDIVFMSIATDKSQVGGLPLQNSFMQLNGTGCVFPCLAQGAPVMRGLVGGGTSSEGVWAHWVLLVLLLSGDILFGSGSKSGKRLSFV